MCRTTPEKEVEIGGYSLNRGNIWPVAEYLPLKQGLKHNITKRYSSLILRCKVPSTKTRIETVLFQHQCLKMQSCRVPSTKTRIETSELFPLFWLYTRCRVPSTKTRIETILLKKMQQVVRCCRVPSTKIRIERPTDFSPLFALLCCRVTSTKTRIETLISDIEHTMILMLQTTFH